MKLVILLGILGITAVARSDVQRQSNGSPLFSGPNVLEFRLEAPLQKVFAAKADETFRVIGSITYGAAGHEVVVPGIEISVRGHTSRREDECTFPKLKLKFTDENATGRSVFANLRSVKLGTHCGEAPDGQFTPKFGRLANEHSPLRESFVYRLLQAVGVTTLLARPARITYVDTDSPSAAPLVRLAMLLEDDDDGQARLGAASEIPPEKFGSARDRFSPADAARIAFAEAMIGNFDWCLKFTADDVYRCDAAVPLWNVVALDRGDGRAFPLIQDFDLAGMVTGHHPWFATVYAASFVASRSPVEIEVISQVQRTRSLYPRQVLDATRHEFLGRREAAFGALAAATLDSGGRSMARQYLDAFFDAIGSDAAFYRRVVAKPGTRVYQDPTAAHEACKPGDAVPPGTPVNELQRTGSMVQVQMLDVYWHWAPPAACRAVQSGGVWVPGDAISADYPPASSPR